MADSKALTLRTTCPKCGRVLESDSLEGLNKLASKCCKSKAKKTVGAVPRVLRETAPATWQVSFDRAPLSQNKTTYSPWYVHHNDKKNWLRRMTEVAPYLGGTYWYSEWEVTRVYGPRNKEMDTANLVGGLKGFFDCLKDTSIIVDDAPKHFKANYLQLKGESNMTILRLLAYRFKEGGELVTCKNSQTAT